MNKFKNQTARVHWHIGQALLPEHFYAQESGLREELNLRLQMSPLPSWGLGGLKWDSFQILEGIISIKELTLVLPSGVLIDIPGNTKPASFNLNTSGATRAEVFLHLQGGYDIAKEGGVDSDETVERVVQKIKLSTVPYSDTAVQTFKLCEFEKSVEGIWSPVENFIPPLVRVDTTPFTDGILQRLQSLALAFQQSLVSEIQQNYLSGESVQAAKQCLRGVYGFIAFLANIRSEIKCHPYNLFRAVHDFYLDVCLLRQCEPLALTQKYEHENFGPCLEQLVELVEEQINLAKTETPYQEFEMSEGMWTCELPEECKTARQVYWLIQKPRVGADIDLSTIKLAGESRLPLVHQRALRGVPFRRLSHAPFHHNFSSTVEFVLLSPGEEWDHAVREGKLSYFNRDEYKNLKTFLYWRND
ncbi:MAG: type VI secretion system baseplate subunit TssK [Myxococcota bacterium]|nr:type VI secretion system baseplate subunit TssK [Myxococcota bacterium]